MHQRHDHGRVHSRPALADPLAHTASAGLLDLEAELLKPLHNTLLEWIAEIIETAPRHVLDLGSGSGAAAFALLDRFAASRVTAMDSSPEMLQHLRHRAVVAGVTERLSVVEADLDDGLPPVNGFDLAWASSSLHHLGNPGTLICEVGLALPVGGWFVVVETEDVPWLLPEDLGMGRAGLEARCHELLAHRRSEHTPHMGADWRAHLERAGLDVRAARVFEVDESAPSPVAGRYAMSFFSMLRSGASGDMDTEDLATLDVLLDETDPRSLTHREDLVLTTTRRAWLAQRPDPRERLR